MKNFDCDLLVIGAGSGGVRAARMAAMKGARVTVVEAGAMGGTCVNLGCIPKKLYSEAARFSSAFKESEGFGWQPGAPTFDWERLKSGRTTEITRLNAVYAQLLADAKVQVISGWGRLVDAHTVSIEGVDGARTLRSASHILLATGGRPRAPSGPGAQWAKVSDDMFDLPQLPRRLAVVGGGYIACEFASIFRGLGVDVDLIHRGPELLRGFDHDIAEFLAQEMRKKGVRLHLNARVDEVSGTAHAQQIRLSDGQQWVADTVLHGIGRVPFTDGLGLEAVGIRVDEDGRIPVDAAHTTVVPTVSAIGDLIAGKDLTPVALAHAMRVVDRLFGDGTRPPMDEHWVPSAVFTLPNVATVGWTEHQAREKFGELRIYSSEFRPLKHTLSGSDERSLMKMVVDARTDRLLGMHMVGADAGEIIQGFAVAVQAGLTKAQLDQTVGIHPTAAEEFVTMRVAR